MHHTSAFIRSYNDNCIRYDCLMKNCKEKDMLIESALLCWQSYDKDFLDVRNFIDKYVVFAI